MLSRTYITEYQWYNYLWLIPRLICIPHRAFTNFNIFNGWRSCCKTFSAKFARCNLVIIHDTKEAMTNHKAFRSTRYDTQPIASVNPALIILYYRKMFIAVRWFSPRPLCHLQIRDRKMQLRCVQCDDIPVM